MRTSPLEQLVTAIAAVPRGGSDLSPRSLDRVMDDFPHLDAICLFETA
jgi:hypothetical protein